jgi:hypothetical protein
MSSCSVRIDAPFISDCNESPKFSKIFGKISPAVFEVLHGDKSHKRGQN